MAKTIQGPVLVTGAGGFIGRCLTAQLLDDGVDVRALLLEGEAVPEAWGDRVTIVRGDVRNAGEIQRAVEGVGTVFHLAALVGIGGTYEDHWTVTVDGSRNIFTAAAGAGARVVVTTSICAYGDAIAKGACNEETERGQYQGAYGRAKQGQEDAALEAHRELGLDIAIVRPSNVYGIGSGPWVDGMIALVQMGSVAVPDDGTGNAGMLYVENLVDALLLVAAEESTNGRIYNVCDGSDVTWRRYFDDIASIAGAGPPPSTPLAPAREAASANEDLAGLGDPKDPEILPLEALNLIGSDNRFDTSRIREELGWTPRVSYEEAMETIRTHYT